MERIEYRTIDKSDWADGPWKDEPDKIQWQDESTGLPCLLKRSTLGFLCGYVGIPQGHPWYGQQVDAEVHGGVTYTGACDGGPEDSSICHVPSEGEDDHVWWVGFDCGHYMDYSHVAPIQGVEAFHHYFGGTYRDVPYVQDQCRYLAEQAAAAA